MGSRVPDWVMLYTRKWGRQKRRIFAGHDWHGNIDGYAECFLGKIMEERDGAGQGMARQHWPEVYWGEGLEVQRIVASPGLSWNQVAVLHMHNVFDPEWGLTVDRKARLIGMKRTAYNEELGNVEHYLWGRLQAPFVPDAQVTEAIEKILHEGLQTASAQVINSHTERVGPQLDFSPLNRPKITIAR